MADKPSQDPLARLVEQARRDPRFFHDLIFDPERVLSKLNYLPRSLKASILAIDPGAFIETVFGTLSDCGVTCNDSCNKTCADSCGKTCGSSCDGTCRKSCKDTISLAFRPQDLVTDVRPFREVGFRRGRSGG